jgi:hypothetical protein
MPHHLKFGITGRTAPCVMQHHQPSARRLGSVAMSRITIYGIQRFNFRMARPLHPPFSNFTCFTDFSCILPMFHNFIQLFLSLPLFLNLRPTSRTSSFILRSPTIKTHVHRQPKRTSLPLRTAQTSYQKTHLKLCIPLVQLCILSHFVAFRTLSLFALCRLSHFITCRTSSRCITPYRSSSFFTAPHHFSSCQVGFFWESSIYIYILSLFSFIS